MVLSRTTLLISAALAFASAALGVVWLLSRSTPLPVRTQPAQVLTKQTGPVRTLLGKSVQGRPIEAFTFSTPASLGSAHTPHKHFVFVGGIHGGYEWNSVALAYTLLDYIAVQQNTRNTSSFIPAGTSVTIIPNLNPDAVSRVLGIEGTFSEADALAALDEIPPALRQKSLEAARFNAHDVDLNRNFGCNWQAESQWKGRKVSAGTAAFSEPEAQALKRFVLTQRTAVADPADLQFIFLHSQADAIYASQCEGKPLRHTLDLLHTYADASGYKAVTSFDAYPVTGAAEDWLASLGIPAITVELSSHTSLDWEQNKAAVDALLSVQEEASRPAVDFR